MTRTTSTPRTAKAKAKSTSKAPPLRLEWVRAGSLADNPANWRRHPKGQMTALKAVLADVDWAGALLYNETTKRLIDGHARKAAVGKDEIVPVLIGRWTPEQERKILATLDPLAAMATADADALESLLAETDLAGEGLDDLKGLLDSLTEESDDDGQRQAAADRTKAEAASAARQRKVSELYSVIVECKSERDQLAFYNRMKKEGRKCKLYVL